MNYFTKQICATTTLICCLSFVVRAGIDNLSGTYSSLPQEYRQYEVLPGAILLETGWIKNVYNYARSVKNLNDFPLGEIVINLYHHAGDEGEVHLTAILINTDTHEVVKKIAQIIFNVGNESALTKFEVKYKISPTTSVRVTINKTTLANASKDNKEFTRNIFLSAIWALGKNNRDVLKTYYDEIARLINQTREAGPSSKTSSEVTPIIHTFEPTRSFSIEYREPFLKELSAWREETAYKKISIESFPLLTEKAAFLALAPGQFPPHTDYDKAQVPGNPEIKFVDCMESMCRNFMNILWYNPHSIQFDQTMLANRKLSPSESLRSFYTTNSNPLDVNNYNVHSAWADLVSGIDNVDYVNKRQAPFKSYELYPTLKNFIILMNHLLDLNLFTAADLTRSNFVQTLFPALCDKLKIDYKWNKAPEDIDTFDQDHKTTLITQLNFNPSLAIFTHEMHTSFRHGEFFGQGEKTIDINLRLTLKDPENPILFPCALWLLCNDDGALQHTALNTYLSLFYLSLDNYDFVLKLTILLPWSKSYSPHTFNILKTFVNKIPDADRKELGLLNLYTYKILKTTSITNDEFTEALTITRTILTSPIAYEYNPSSMLLSFLIHQAQKYLNNPDEQNKIAPIAAVALLSTDDNIRAEATKLFDELFKQGKGFKEAAQAAASTLSRDEGQTNQIATELLKSLINNHHYREAAQAIAELLATANLFAQTEALPELINMLFDAHQGYDELAQAAATNTTNPNSLARLNILSIFDKLFEAQQGYEKAAQAAASALMNPDLGIRKLAFQLYSKLFKIQKEFAAAATAATAALQNPEWQVREAALYLFQNLVDARQEYPSAIQAAQTAISDKDDRVRISAQELFEKLFKKEQSYSQAIATIEANLASPNEALQWSAESLKLRLKQYFDGHPDALKQYLKTHPVDETKLKDLKIIK